MISDFTPIVHKLDGRTIKVWAVADVHIGARESNTREFAKFVERIKADGDSYVVLCGDMINNGVKDSLTNVYEETMPPSLQVEKAVELLEPIADKILGCVGGNHERRSKKAVDLDPMYTIMCMLRKQDLYRPSMAFVRINLERGKTKEHYALLLVHGASANKKRHFAYSVEGVDAIISGHTHDGIVEKPARLVFTKSNNVKIQPLVSLTATSWVDYGGYASRALYLPKTVSNPQFLELEFTGTNARDGNIRVVW